MKRPASQDIDFIGCEAAGTIPGLLMCRAERTPNAVAYSEFDNGVWRDVTWREMERIVTRYRAALDQAGMAHGDRVAILLPNCVDWIAFDIAAMANGLITVPLYLHDSATNISFILSNSGARLCLVESVQTWEPLRPTLESASALSQIWLRRDRETHQSVGKIKVRSLVDVLDVADGDPGSSRCAAQDIATVIHTSGTTGRPKGAMLSHHALLWDAEAVAENIPPLTGDTFLSLLPLAHAFERTMSYHLAMMGGSRVVFARAIETLRQDISEVRPTILVAVPRLYERLYEAIVREASQNPIKRWLVLKTAAIGWQRFKARHGRETKLRPMTHLLYWPLLKRLVARPVLQAFGGRVRVAVSGGAPLSTDVSHFLIGLGLPLVEGYGLTEAAPVITGTTLEDNMPGSVGKPLRGIETRFSADGELLIRSPSLMQGYWNDPERSAAAIDGDGWLHTGDIAEFRENHLFITGRLKDLIVLSTGKNVAATEVEAAIEADPLFEQCCALGNNRAFVAAVLVLNCDHWAAFAERNGLDPDVPNAPDANVAILARVAQALRDQPSFAQVRAVHSQLQPWTVEDGSVTPTLKIKRHLIEERYGPEIEAFVGQQMLRRRSEGEHKK
ncbi:AMP-dependent synthetase/ligase [Tateyamaria pelophila]|uniref:AMP-dependent synthetase/ligase n=1 Tax=Tateyamaria pelophila TaxID=328415 RepID=UPI002958B8EA|nr:AMP-dependent synthetase/ligase [Tateyamaria pelophila]